MEAASAELQKKCQLALPIRDRTGRVRFRENPEVIRKVNNLGRRMLLARFEDCFRMRLECSNEDRKD